MMTTKEDMNSIQMNAKVAGVLYLFITTYKTGPVYLALPIAIAEIAFPLWLLIKGVNVDRWENRARESAPLVPMPIG